MALLDPGRALTLRPMKYPQFYNHFIHAQENNWSVQEISFGTDVADLRDRLTVAEKHVVSRLVAFFATGDSIVGNNLVLNLYKHVNSPEARLYYSRQIFEEALHVQFYLTLLDNYVPDMAERQAAFDAINSIPSIKEKADFCFRWMNQVEQLEELRTAEQKRQFLMNLITFAAAVEGLFFFAAFAYVYYLRNKGLLHGLAAGTNWVFRDESMHMNVAFEIVDTIRHEEPDLWDAKMEEDVKNMLDEAIRCEMQFADDMLNLGVVGLSKTDMLEYLKFTADTRLNRLGIASVYNAKNPFSFMELQDMQSLTNFFERTVSEYAVGVSAAASDITLDLDF
jgi:ribonucleoside-diphosphate reductase beta chain